MRAAIEAEGRARVETIHREARERIARLRAQSRARAELRRTELLRARERELRTALARDLARARADAQRRALEARSALLERVFTRARERLDEGIERPAARARLIARAREALTFVPPGQVEIVCSPGVAAVLEQGLELPEGATLETQASLPAGFRVTGAGGALLVDATLESLLALERPLLAIEVLKQLAAEDA